MVKKFSELKIGDRLLLVYPNGLTRKATCLTNPMPTGNLNIEFDIGWDLNSIPVMNITRERDRLVPVFGVAK